MKGPDYFTHINFFACLKILQYQIFMNMGKISKVFRQMVQQEGLAFLMTQRKLKILV